MKKKIQPKTPLFLSLFFLGLIGLSYSGKVGATPFPNPDPSTLGNDLDDPGLFVPSTNSFSIELFDAGPFFSLPGNTFGFFYAGDPSTRITIFDPLDEDPDPSGPGSIPQVAIVDFSSGIVFDVDDGNSVQDTFTPMTESIGFFLTPDPGFGLGTLFTVPSMNSGGADLVATFPLLSPLFLPNEFILSFQVEDPSTGAFNPVALELVGGVQPVPEPASLLLFFTGLVVLGTLKCVGNLKKQGMLPPLPASRSR